MLAPQRSTGLDLSRVSESGRDATGVRPSAGAARLESERDVMESGAWVNSMVAAPEDGRTPPEPSAAIPDPLLALAPQRTAPKGAAG